MKLSLSLLLLIVSLGVAVASSSPPPPTPAPEKNEGGRKRNRKCGPRCRRRKERLLGQPTGPPQTIPGNGNVVDKQLGNSSAFVPAVPASSPGYPSGPRGPSVPSSSFPGYGPSGPGHEGPPGPRSDFSAGRVLPPSRIRGDPVGPPGLLDIPYLCPGENQIFVGNNQCICDNGFVMNRKKVCRPLKKRKGRY